MSSEPNIKKTQKKWRSISIKRSLINEIEKYIEDTKRYRSISEFVTEAARLRLEQFGYKIPKGKSHA